ncbi:hypothetical protein PQ459_09840 [Chryseobacterium sp. KACC 21268]|nr:hypothetical protein PQ459_09840 [Chryseobacterium sp. KACC 21268]
MRYFISLLLVTIFCSCSKEIKEKNYTDKDLEIDLPVGWTISDQEDFGTGKYFAIEKNGFNSSGVVTISFVESDRNLEEWIEMNMDELKSSFILKKADVKFGKIIQTKFQNMDALSSEYRLNLLGVGHSGVIYAFSKNGRVFAFMQQGADEDSDDNESGFAHLQSNLIIK